MIGASKELCDRAGMPCSVFSDVQGNPVEQNVIDGVEAYKTNGCDGVIAFVRIFVFVFHTHISSTLYSLTYFTGWRKCAGRGKGDCTHGRTDTFVVGF